MPSARGWALLGAGCAFFVLWWAFGDPELLLAGVFLVLAPLTAVAYVRLHSPRVRISRRIGSPAVHDGDTTMVTLVVDNLTRRAVPHLSLLDEVERLGVAGFELARLPRGERATASYRVTCSPRGVYRVGPARGHAADPLGLAELSVGESSADRLVVYPKIETLSGFPRVRGRDPLVQAARPEHSQRGGEDFYTLREYQRGDDLRRIHWPSVAKTDELMIRQLETPWQSRALVLLDIRDQVYESAQAFETAVSGAASIVDHLVRSGFDADFWAGEANTLDASRYATIMERLAVVRTDPAIDIRAVATRIRHRGGGGALILVTGVADREMLAVQQLLSCDYGNTVLMSVSSTTPQTLIGFQRAGAATVVVEPGGRWAPTWLKTMRSTWADASVS
jgi:uncharacterized protein (DUF58 family)|nr:MAG: hypothetical protein DIU67_01680 [Actinomycetota bacterium]